MYHVGIYHNLIGPKPDTPGDPLRLVTSHWIALVNADPTQYLPTMMREAFLCPNVLDILENHRHERDFAEEKFLMASLYWLFGYRPLKCGDVIHITSGPDAMDTSADTSADTSTWLALTPDAWQQISPPPHADGEPLTADTVRRLVEAMSPLRGAGLLPRRSPTAASDLHQLDSRDLTRCDRSDGEARFLKVCIQLLIGDSSLTVSTVLWFAKELSTLRHKGQLAGSPLSRQRTNPVMHQILGIS